MSKRKPDDWQPKTVYRTGVWWIRDGEFGGMTNHATPEEAAAEREQQHKLGYDRPGICESRTIKVTTERIA